MKSLWCDQKAQEYKSDLDLRVYTSQLLGSDPALVLHGGGNTSVKCREVNLFGDEQQILYVKGSGWDLASIEAPGFAPVKMDVLLQMAELQALSDSDMVTQQRAAMTDPSAPNPSVEAILHAVIPYKYVDHSHADAVVTLSNTPKGEELIHEVYGDRVLIIPYVMPGFELARQIVEMTRDLDWSSIEGLVLMNHGLFSFADNARRSYENHIELVSQAEDYLAAQGATLELPAPQSCADLVALAKIRQSASRARGQALVAHLNDSPLAVHFSNQDVPSLSSRGTLTPEHVIRTKRAPLFIDGDVQPALDRYVMDYKAYFDRNHNQDQICLNPAPSYALWKGQGAISFGKSLKEAQVIRDINDHTFEAILKAEKLGGYQALDEPTLFEIEYWELEQAKLKKTAGPVALTGKVALVIDNGSDYSTAITSRLQAQGAAVVKVTTSDDASRVETCIRTFGGLDILAGPTGQADTGLIEAALEFMALGVDPVVIDTRGGDLKVEAPIRFNGLTLSDGVKAEAVATLVADLAGEAFDGVSGARLSL